jgi:hypothetical protein
MAASAGRHIIGENYSVSAELRRSDRRGDPSAAACGLRRARQRADGANGLAYVLCGAINDDGNSMPDGK